MTLKAKITAEEHAKLADPLKAEYVERDGAYFVDVAQVEGWALEDVHGLRSALETTRNERNTLQAATKEFEGVDLNEVKRLLSKKEEIDSWSPDNDEAFKARLEEAQANLQRKYDTDLGAANERAESLSKKYRTYLCRADAVAAINAEKGPVDVLLPHVLERLSVFEADGRDAVFVSGDDGKPRITQQAGETGNMTARELVATLKENEAFRPLFPGSGATGGGTTGGSGAKGNPVDSSLSPEQRLAQHRAQVGA